MVEGSLGERLLITAIAGIIGTCAVMAAAGFGPMFLRPFDTQVLKWTAALAIIAIAALIAELPVSNKLPMGIMITGIVIGGLVK